MKRKILSILNGENLIKFDLLKTEIAIVNEFS